MNKIRPKIREDLQKTPIEVTTSSSDVADEEHFFFTQTDDEDDTKDQKLERKKQSRKKATDWVANEEPSSMKTNIKELTKFGANSTSYYMNEYKANALIRKKQDVNVVLRNLIFKTTGQSQVEALLATNRRKKHYKANEDRIILKKDSNSGYTMEKLEASINITFSKQSIWLMKYSRACTENLEGTPELPRPKLPTDRNTIIETQRC